MINFLVSRFHIAFAVNVRW